MYTIEFETDVKNGMIKIPEQYKDIDTRHVKVIAIVGDSGTRQSLKKKQVEEKPQYSDEYLKENWRELIMTGLGNYDESYYRSEQYKEDRGAYLMEMG